MCGIIGYIGKREAKPIILDGLKRLEYRGYDSAGIAILHEKGIDIRKTQGKIKDLESLLGNEDFHGNTGIGHTRWATHGRPSDINAHPHKVDGVALVHNGIIENYLSMKANLEKKGHRFISETDSEVISALIYTFLKKGLSLEKSLIKSLNLIKGSYALALIYEGNPEILICARKESPLIIGLGDGENFLASDIPAIIKYTRKMIFLEDGEIGFLTKDNYTIRDLKERVIHRPPKDIPWDPLMAEKEGYKHFMLKEIHEQPQALINCMRSRLSETHGTIAFDNDFLPAKEIKRIKRIILVACGTSYHAALVGRYMLEEISLIPTNVDMASEFRYGSSLMEKGTLIVPISQSGETADTIKAAREGKKGGASLLSICNVLDSSLVRESDGILYTYAGPEIGVASTKTFITQIVALFLLTLYLARLKKVIDTSQLKEYLHILLKIPRQMTNILSREKEIEGLAKKYMASKDFLFLGRGINYPVALEGALKLKEISYIHAEGYPAGEMKHGPIALIDSEMPVAILLKKDKTFGKIMGNIEEVKARGGKVILFSDYRGHDIRDKAEDIFYIPTTIPPLSPLLFTIPLQLFAYYTALCRGTDIDQPRNLAKSVTVE